MNKITLVLLVLFPAFAKLPKTFYQARCWCEVTSVNGLKQHVSKPGVKHTADCTTFCNTQLPIIVNDACKKMVKNASNAATALMDKETCKGTYSTTKCQPAKFINTTNMHQIPAPTYTDGYFKYL